MHLQNNPTSFKSTALLTLKKQNRLQLLVTCSALSSLVLVSTSAYAQITPDNTLGTESSLITPNVLINGANSDRIEGGAVRGGNLFHSFSQFNINDGQRVYFSNPVGVENIFTRVTGAQVSNILGTLGVDGSANLFLLNPNGILFGLNARLDVSGSFIGSTANSIKFLDNTEFNAKTPQSPSLLTISVPVGLQFGANPTAIKVKGDGQGIRTTSNLIDTPNALRVQPDRTLALVGGDLSLEGATLKTAGGRIELGSVGSESLVSLIPSNKGFSLSYGGVQNFSNIELSQKAAVDASGAGGGDVLLTGKNVTLTDGSQVEASTLGSQPGENVTVNAQESVKLIGSSADGQPDSGLFVAVYSDATGKGGDLKIQTSNLLVQGGAEIVASTFGAGNGGSLSVTANRVQISDGYLRAQASQNATGNAGSLTINTGTLLLKDGAQVSAGTFGAGNGGSLTVNASEKIELTDIGSRNRLPSGLFTEQAVQGGKGIAGNLTVDTPFLLVKDSALVSASTFGKGAAGDLTVNTGTLKVQNGAVVRADTFGAGSAGNLTINTGNLLVNNGAGITASTFDVGKGGNLSVTAESMEVTNGFLRTQTDTNATSNAGNLDIKTGNLRVQNGAEIVASTFGSGNGGSLSITADRVEMSGGHLRTQARQNATGNAGNLTINTGTLLLKDGAQASTGSFGAGNGGSLTVNAFEKIELTDIGSSNNLPSGLFTEQAVQGGKGMAGNLTIDTPFLLVKDRAFVSTSTFGEGAGGNLNIKTGTLQVQNGAQVTASTFDAGKGGNLSVTAESVEVANGFLRTQANTNATDNAGDLIIQTGNLLVKDGGQVSSGTLGKGNGGNLTVNATKTVEVIGNSASRSPSGLFTQQNTQDATGTAGNLTIDTPFLLVKDGALVSASTVGQGAAGDLRINTGTLQVQNGAVVFADTFGAGSAGNLTINAGNLLVNDGAVITASTNGAGKGGTLSVAAESMEVANGFLRTQANTNATANAGNLNIKTGNLLVKDGGQVSAGTQGKGNGGNLTLNATKTVEVIGNSASSQPSGLFTQQNTQGATGTAGNLTIDTPLLLVKDGALVSASTFGAGAAGDLRINTGTLQVRNGAVVRADTSDTGAAGNLTINTGNLLVNDGADITSGTFNTGKGGNLSVTAESVEVANGFLRTQANTNNTANAGDLIIKTGNLLVKDGGQVSAGTLGKGNGGNLTVNATKKVEVIGNSASSQPSGLFTQQNTQDATGTAGNLTIDTPFLLVKDRGAFISASTSGKGVAGDLRINTGTLQVQNGAVIRAGTDGAGKGGSLTVNATEKAEVIGTTANGQRTSLLTETTSSVKEATAGNLTINTPMLLVKDGAIVSASTFGAGNGGSLTVNASEKVEVTGTTPNGKSSSRLSANTLGTGNAGNLTINTRALIVRDSQVSASTLGEGNAGNLTVKAAESIELSGVFFGDTDDYPAGLFAQVNSEGTGRGGKLTVETGRLSISNGAKVQVATFGTGDAGDLFILASDIDIFETPRSKYTYFAGGIYAGVQTTRDAIKPPKGYGGSVTIETNRLRVRDGGTVTTTTEGLGDAGSLRIRATESVEVFGISPDGQFSSEISAATTPQSIGFGGSMSIDTGKLTIADRGMVTVQNRNNGQAGNLKINARSVNLDKGTISATTLSGNGGNIILDIGDILLLRNNSQISTTAGTAQQGGDGGNIDIQSKYIIAIPEEDSDITANAFEGRGGNIHINSQGIFGIESRSQRTERSDITASSELGVAGEIALIAPDNSTIVNSLSELPQNPIDTNALIANSCIARTQKQEGTFTITGSGGLPYRPGDTSISLYSTGDVRGVLPNTSTSWKQGDPIVEPTGVYRLNNGKLVMSRECS